MPSRCGVLCFVFGVFVVFGMFGVLVVFVCLFVRTHALKQARETQPT
jgi:hypothetical protein